MRSSVWHCQESFLWFSSKKLELLIFAKTLIFHFPIFCSLNHIFHVQTNFREAHFSQISFNALFFDVLSSNGGQTSSNEAFSSRKFCQKFRLDDKIALSRPWLLKIFKIFRFDFFLMFYFSMYQRRGYIFGWGFFKPKFLKFRQKF